MTRSLYCLHTQTQS